MKSFFKQNLLYILLFTGASTIFIVLLALSFSYSEATEELISDINSLHVEKDDLTTNISSFGHIEIDHEASISDLSKLASKEKDLLNFLNYLVNSKENVSSKWDSKSAESVNASLTRLFSRLRKKCKDSNIILPSDLSQVSDSSPFSSSGTGSKDSAFGFSFSAYDGFWPSFSANEARQIGVQSEIVKSLVDAITLSSDGNHSIEILSLQRENVGDIDKANIGLDLIDLSGLETILLRQVDGVESYVFRITVKIQTFSLRKLINKLRPPFLLREVSISPVEDTASSSSSSDNSFELDPFNTDPVKEEKFIPIVSKVDSKVDIVVEYIVDADRNLQDIYENLKFSSDSHSEICIQWLEKSGNKILSGKAKKFLDEDNR
jgi:hypothetical protein